MCVCQNVRCANTSPNTWSKLVGSLDNHLNRRFHFFFLLILSLLFNVKCFRSIDLYCIDSTFKKKVTNQNRFSRECSRHDCRLHENIHSSGISLRFKRCFIVILWMNKNSNRIQSQKRNSQSNESCAIFLTNLIHLCEALIQFACWFDGAARRYSFYMYSVVVCSWNWNEFLLENDYENYSTPIIRYRFCTMEMKKTVLVCAAHAFVLFF